MTHFGFYKIISLPMQLVGFELSILSLQVECLTTVLLPMANLLKPQKFTSVMLANYSNM
jgi:hypothetical protein